jgi:hypothetical protein
MYMPVWSTPFYSWFCLHLSSFSSLVQQVTWYNSSMCEVCMQKLHTYCWEKIFSSSVIYIYFSEVLSGFLFSVILHMVYRRRVSIQNCSVKFSMICFLLRFFHFTWTESICFCSPYINSVIK